MVGFRVAVYRMAEFGAITLHYIRTQGKVKWVRDVNGKKQAGSGDCHALSREHSHFYPA